MSTTVEIVNVLKSELKLARLTYADLGRELRLAIIELKPLNRYRLKVAKTFRWRANGPVMQFFRDHGVVDYFSGGFDGESEMVSLVHGHISLPMAKVFQERLQRVAQDFAQQH